MLQKKKNINIIYISAADLGQELNTELSHMVGDLQRVLDRKHMPSSQPGSEDGDEDDAEDDDDDEKIEAEKLSYHEKTDENDSLEEKAIQVKYLHLSFNNKIFITSY